LIAYAGTVRTAWLDIKPKIVYTNHTMTLANDVNPLLLDLPHEILTPRLILRKPRIGDELFINPAIVESFSEISKWLPWAKTLQTEEESKLFIRQKIVAWEARTDLYFPVIRKHDEQFLGAVGLFRIDWKIRNFEIGYWLRSSAEGHGYMTETVIAITRFVFEALEGNRLELRCDSQNTRSAAVATRLGFELEGKLRRDSLTPDLKQRRDTLVYSRLGTENLPELKTELRY